MTLLISKKKRFWPGLYCAKGKWPLAETYYIFDTDLDGVISQEEAFAASLCSSPDEVSTYGGIVVRILHHVHDVCFS